MLIVNVAAKCGYTYQFGGLAELQDTYGAQGLTVLGFYCNQFMQQAGTEQEQENVETTYGVNFPVSKIINVNPPDEHPIFTWLKAQPVGDGAVQWNFEKFLVGRDGVLISRFTTQTEPTSASITTAIESAL
ncbi:MAG: glutathione peroxidase [Polyangia bacterium]|nr:glutathione peroxidase [Polyangia bacterium]